MPHRLTWEGEILCLELSGAVGEADFRALGPEFLRLETSRAAAPDRLTDLSGATSSSLSFTEIAALADLRKQQRFGNAFKSAVVAPRPVQYGFARMFQTLNDHPQITIRVFRDRASALAWLQVAPAAIPAPAVI